MEERVDVGVARAGAEKDFVSGENVVFAAFGFGLVGVKPPGVYAFLEERGIGIVPILLARGGVGGVVERLADGVETSVPATIGRAMVKCHLPERCSAQWNQKN